MTVKIRRRRNPSGATHWQADIHVTLPSGETLRERRRAPGTTRRAALRWARAREAHLVRHGKQAQTRGSTGSPTVAEFYERLKADYILADRLRPTTVHNWERVMRDHVLPVVGEVSLRDVGPSHIQALKRRELAARTTNLVLAKLHTLLRKAVDWGALERAPKIERLKIVARTPAYLDFDPYARLVVEAEKLGRAALLIVLLGGDAGLRRGEILGLRWRSVHFDNNRLLVRENAQGARVGPTKGGRDRWVPMTRQLRAALERAERLGERVITLDSGAPLSASRLRRLLVRAQARAGLEAKGAHVLRHTFCSHLAMRGVSAVKIQKLAGHAHLSTTQAYMHLAPSSLDDAIAALDR